ncbi:MAG: DUF1778 domain-containing protein [Chloroflexia bacterium]|nr:DUF1778 domain-containing protein [Chloroflexia bacterium]
MHRAVDSTVRAIERHEVVRLSAQDSRRVAEMLLEPPEPTATLSEAARRYREQTSS